MTASEIIRKYTEKAITLEEANQLLEENGSTVRLDPFKNVISGQEFADTKVSDDPAEVTGWGMMNHGVGSMEKMHVQDGKFDYDTGFRGNTAVLYIKGKMFRVEGDHIEVYAE